MKRLTALPYRSAYLFGGLILLALIMTLFVYIEVTQSREELLEMVRSEASILIETLNRGGETTIRANAELEETLVDRLIVSTRLIDHLDSEGHATQSRLALEAHELDLALILLFDQEGKVVSSSHPLPAEMQGKNLEAGMKDVIQPVLSGNYVWTTDGDTYSPWTDDALFVLAHERISQPGAIIVGVRASTLLEARKRLGIGKLVQDIGKEQGVAYVLLQDVEGILTASLGLAEMNSIAEDEFLTTALFGDSVYTRIREYAGEPVFEVVKSLIIPSNQPVLSRIGLSLERVRNIQQRSMRRVIFIAIGFFITAAILLILLLLRQRFVVLETEHRKVRSYNELVLDGIADAVVATDSDGIITVFNKAAERLFRLSVMNAHGENYGALFPDDPVLLSKTAEQQSPVSYEETALQDSESETHHLAVSTSLIRGKDGSIESIVAIARDVTEQRRAQENLARKDRLMAMGELAGGIAHEIRNPLNAINIIAQRFQVEFQVSGDTEEFHQLNKTIRSEVQRVNNIITQFLEFARPARLSLERANMATLLRGSVDVIRSQALKQDVHLMLIIDDDLPVRADREKMQQVFLNLLQNALDAVEAGGEIKCIACRQNDKVMVSIADNGKGIPEKIQSKIFNLYYTTKSSGTGLGLSIVHQIIGEHGGEISVTSTEGGGTTFRIVLPTR